MTNEITQTKSNLQALNPTTLDQAMQFAEILSKSSIVPKDFQGNPGNILVAIQWGYELNLQPMQAMQSIAVINGRPSLWGDAILAMARASGKLESIDETVENNVATCTVKRKGEPAATRTFSLEEAKKAGLTNRPTWQAYPNRMLQMRARGFALRDVFTDILRGFEVAEEAVDKEPIQLEPAQEVKAKKSRKEVVAQALENKSPSKEDTINLNDLLMEFKVAQTLGELKASSDKARLLENKEDMQKARDLYMERHVELQQTKSEQEA